jgi:hypothetical protein
MIITITINYDHIINHSQSNPFSNITVNIRCGLFRDVGQGAGRDPEPFSSWIPRS